MGRTRRRDWNKRTWVAGRCAEAAWLEGLAQRLGEVAAAKVEPKWSHWTGEKLGGWMRQMMPRHFGLPFGEMQRWLLRRLAEQGLQRGMRLNVVGPRGSAKSTLISLGYVAWRVFTKAERYIWLVSETGDQARGQLANLRRELEQNELLARGGERVGARGERLSAGVGSIWRDDLIVTESGVAIEALGRGERTRGRRFGEHRPSLMICDDLVGERQGYSSKERQRTREWFWGTLLPAGDARTNVIHVSTPQHANDLGQELERDAGWETRRFAAVIAWPTRRDLWETWEQMYLQSGGAGKECARRFFEEHRSEMEAGAVLDWPEREDLYGLFCKRAELGPRVFERELQGGLQGGGEAEFEEAWLGEEVWVERWPEVLTQRVIAVDPSEGKGGERGDYSAIVLLGFAEDGKCYVEGDLARRGIVELVQELVRRQAEFAADAVVVETNVYRELLASAVQAEAERQGEKGLPLWGMENRVNKERRIRRLGPVLHRSGLRFVRGSAGTELLVEQLKAFPRGEHDDGPDALEMGLRIGSELGFVGW